MDKYYISLKEFKKNPKAFSSNEINRLCSIQHLSEKFMREMKDHLNWICISRYQKMSEPFMEEMRYYIVWYELCGWNNQTVLTEQFMDKMALWLDWNAVSRSRKFGEEFMLRHLDQLNPDRMQENSKLRDILENYEKFITTFLKYDRYSVKWAGYNYPSNISIEFIREYKDVIDFSKFISSFISNGKGTEFVDEFHNYFNNDTWDRIEGRLYDFDFDFILKYSDHWKYGRYNNPADNWRNGNKYTPEQRAYLRSMWNLHQ